MPKTPISAEGCPVETPLVKKLGLLSAKVVAGDVVLLGAPEEFVPSLGELPAGLRFRARMSAGTTLAICFVRSVLELEAVMEMVAVQLPKGASVWIVRPKQHLKPGFHENHVRQAGLVRGLVDYKICSIDEDWSAIKFAWRKVVPAKA